MPSFTVQRHPNAEAFFERAEDWLMQAEAEHNLLLGLARRLADSSERYEPPIYLATVEGEGKVKGCAFRTPPFKLGLTRMPSAAIAVLAEDVARVYTSLPAVLGPEAERGSSPRRGARSAVWTSGGACSSGSTSSTR